ncbi:hypothetical protein GDO81_010987 [Engystomops pustulosus]|uniref:Uncharacterized protein n=1 Tax=Engystomops pustulosus TaxID=76066 RepID=A0AAV7C3X3_ENGPU|nr:hypothetical protein GDO81_010987 [Engystomops pustulosus]
MWGRVNILADSGILQIRGHFGARKKIQRDRSQYLTTVILSTVKEEVLGEVMCSLTEEDHNSFLLHCSISSSLTVERIIMV